MHQWSSLSAYRRGCRHLVSLHVWMSVTKKKKNILIFFCTTKCGLSGNIKRFYMRLCFYVLWFPGNGSLQEISWIQARYANWKGQPETNLSITEDSQPIEIFVNSQTVFASVVYRQIYFHSLENNGERHYKLFT